MCNLGWLYEAGQGVRAEGWEKAAEWYLRSAEAGSGRAMGNLAWCYDNGKGVEQDHAEAARWFQRGAESGDVRSMYCLAWDYEHGEGVRPASLLPRTGMNRRLSRRRGSQPLPGVAV